MVDDITITQQQITPPVTRQQIPLSKGNFIPLARNGFGDPANAYAHSMAWFNGKLYAGIARYCYHANRPYNLEDNFEVFPVKLREFNWELDWRAQIWRYDPLTAAWDNVHISPMCMGSMGFEVPLQIGFRDMAVFQGKGDPAPALYTVSWGSHMGDGPFVLRSSDGEVFEEAAPSDRQYFGTQTLRALAVFKGRLFTIPTGRDSGVDGAHNFQAGVVLESNDPTHGGWKPVSEPFFGDPGNVMLFDMAPFNGFLYVGTMNPYEGFQVWKTDAEGSPPYKWQKVLSHGAYRGKLNEGVCSFCAFGDYLYMGTGIYAGGYDRIFDVGPGAPELIRLDKDDHWELIVGEPRQTPQGLQVPASGYGPGFNNPFVGYFWRMCAHDGWLYLGTLVWSPWIPFASQDAWPEQLKKMAEPIPLDKFLSDFGGFDLWRTKNGHKWYPITRNGFDNPFNCGVRSMISTPHGLVVSCVNLFGPEVAIKRAAGWRYEINPKGGVEVWLGTHHPPEKEITIAGKPDPTRPLPQNISLSHYHQVIPAAEILREFYSGSNWHHIGYWDAQTKNPAEACENLIEHLLSFVRPEVTTCVRRIISKEEIHKWAQERITNEDGQAAEGKRGKTIVDLSGFSWITSKYLERHCHDDLLLTVVAEQEIKEITRQGISLDNLIVSKIPKLNIASNSSDTVISMEGFNQCRKKASLFKEIYRILKPGGQMVCSDIIFADAGKFDLRNKEDYMKSLAKIGFSSFHILDMTNKCADPYRKFQQDFIRLKRLSKNHEEEILDDFISMLPDKGKPLHTYLLILAQKK
jgi:SAM-dependent methyltransferase